MWNNNNNNNLIVRSSCILMFYSNRYEASTEKYSLKYRIYVRLGEFYGGRLSGVLICAFGSLKTFSARFEY
jgi:hypothetical protein